MRIYYYTNASYISSLATVLEKDPASLEGWQCMHFQPHANGTFEWPEIVLQKLKEEHAHTDCDILVCSDNDIICMGRELSPTLLHKLAALFSELVEGCQIKKTEYSIYDVFFDWRNVLEVLKRKNKDKFDQVYSVEGVNFGEIASLTDVFAEVEKRRKRRMPLHVMLVEDDALTRRIVSGSFKEKYALITAVNAHEAVASYLLHAPDIMFLDIGLPDANGFEVLHRILQCDPQAYIVMFSSNSYLDNITRAMGIGASGFVSKPFRREKMQSYIEDAALHHRKYA